MHFKPLFTLLLGVVITAANARVARCTGVFQLGNDELPAALDINSLDLNSQIHQIGPYITAFLTVTPTFDITLLKDENITILQNQAGNRLHVRCRRHQLPLIAAMPGVSGCSVSLSLFPSMDSVRNQCHINEVHAGSGELPISYTGKDVLVGIIDSEFDTHHPAFLDSSGVTRFIALWDQYDSTGAIVNSFGCGTIKNHSELIADPSFGLGDDSHGTHTSSTAAGSDWQSGFYGGAPEAMIAGVRYSGTGEIPDGLRWLSLLADSLKVPLVVNMSIGTAVGPHDGTSIIDQVIDSISGEGKIIVGAAGNDGGLPTHISYTLAPQETGKTWMLPRIDSTDVIYRCYFGAQFWGEPGKQFSGTFYVMDRRTFSYVKSSSQFSTLRPKSSKTDTILWYDSLSKTTDTMFMQFAVMREAPRNNKPAMAIYGLTSNPHLVIGIAVENPGTAATTIHGWNLNRAVFHDFGWTGFKNGDTEYTVNEVGGTAKRNITVGAYTARTVIPLWNGELFLHDNCTPGDIFISSGAGPTIDNRVKPDITAPGWSIVAAISRGASRGRDEIALWPDTTTTLSRYGGETGTSMASPVIAGIVALLLEAKPDLTPEEAKQFLMSSAITDRFTGAITSPVNKWGAGKVNAAGALAKLLNIAVSRQHSLSVSSADAVRLVNGHLLIRGVSAGTHPEIVLAVTDLQGRQVLMTAISGNRRSVSLPRLSAGVYSYRLYNGKTNVTVAKNNFVVQK
jgi:minor extracellular serine protease Vpr